MEGNCGFTNLPDELLILIFIHCDERTLCCAAATCTRWRRVALDRHLWRSLCSRLPGCASYLANWSHSSSSHRGLARCLCAQERQVALFRTATGNEGRVDASLDQGGSNEDEFGIQFPLSTAPTCYRCAYIACFLSERNIRRGDVRWTAKRREHFMSVICVSYARGPAGDVALVTVSSCRSIVVFDPSSMQPFFSQQFPGSRPWAAVAIGDVVLATSELHASEVCLWDPRSGTLTAIVSTGTAFTMLLHFTCGTHLFAVTSDNRMSIVTVGRDATTTQSNGALSDEGFALGVSVSIRRRLSSYTATTYGPIAFLAHASGVCCMTLAGGFAQRTWESARNVRCVIVVGPSNGASEDSLVPDEPNTWTIIVGDMCGHLARFVGVTLSPSPQSPSRTTTFDTPISPDIDVPNAHRAPLCCATLCGATKSVVATSGLDGLLRLWTTDLVPIATYSAQSLQLVLPSQDYYAYNENSEARGDGASISGGGVSTVSHSDDTHISPGWVTDTRQDDEGVATETLLPPAMHGFRMSATCLATDHAGMLAVGLLTGAVVVAGFID